MGVTVTLPDGRLYTVNTLLGDGDSNIKLTKSDKANKGYLTVGLSLSPARESGYEMCGSRSIGCTQACIFTSGMGQIHAVRDARVAKTILFMEQREAFKAMLFSELVKANRKAKRQGKALACRPNVFSDVMWEKIFPDMFTEFADVQFYDYTKHYRRMLRTCPVPNPDWPKNYNLTFSRSENNEWDCKSVLLCGGNVTVVFDSKAYPSTYWGYNVVNGDETDLRFLDPNNVVIGLYAKGKGRQDSTGFIVPTLSLIKR